MNKTIFITILNILILSTAIKAQEVLTFPTSIPEIQYNYNKNNTITRETVTSVKLPFYDDFSKITVFPSSKLWIDSFAYVNTDFAKHAPTIGVATLDAIDQKGKLYPNASTFPFNADKLTSRPIRLDSVFIGIPRPLKRSDSLYFSFYYQPEGRGLLPSHKDSLILEFHSPLEFDTIVAQNGDTTYTPVWTHVWSTPGGIGVNEFAFGPNRYFRQVIIPVQDSARYYKDGFQFRFRNIASLANDFVPDWKSNCDQWNIDVVWLNVDRNIHDTVIQDVAFAENAPSMLKNYQAMPTMQYSANFINEMADTLNISIANLDKEPLNLSYKYMMQKNSEPLEAIYNGGSYYIEPYNLTGYSQYQPFARPKVSRFFPPMENNTSTVYKIYHIISNDPNPLFNSNDTIVFSQVFSNYYAYDNGTAEAGIGLNNASGAYVVKFTLNKPDTLHAIKMFFNQVLGNVNIMNVDLIIMNDKSGKPNNIVKQISNVTPIYTSNINEFATYSLDEPLFMNAANFPGLIFYVGWKQYSNNNLNVGFDRYIDTYQQRFYNVYGYWEQSLPSLYGSLMIRPVVGAKNPLKFDITKDGENYVSIYPNPSNDGIFSLNLPESWEKNYLKDIIIQVYNTSGKCVDYINYNNKLDLSHLQNGIYILKIINTSTKETFNTKAIIVK